MSRDFAIDLTAPVPLFPLPNVVLLPHATIPLHIFEPRYRAMVHDALEADKLMAMALFAGDAWKSDYEGTPPLRPCVCVGYVARHEQMPDGRCNILLQGLMRAKIVDEDVNRAYRLGYLDALEPEPAMEIDLDDERRRLEALLSDPVFAGLTPVAAINNLLNGDLPTTALIDLIGMTCCQEVDAKYDLLAEPDAVHRAQMIRQHLNRLRDHIVDQHGG
jgi:Lon protease-like protein